MDVAPDVSMADPATESDTMRAFVERYFGTDEAFGVTFIADDGTCYTPSESDSLYARRGDACPALSAQFPDGSITNCTGYAMRIYRALPDRAQIYGFENCDNPTSRVAREEIHPGGHDFAVIDERYIVDPWVRLVPGACSQICFDLADPVDAAFALDLYGPRACWTRNEAAERFSRTLDPGGWHGASGDAIAADDGDSQLDHPHV
ncbi:MULTISPECIES: hypothetical protein [unclassified Burkholderia]|uniref:hypothetical protein n=1 Tax=unclassified Burkholderia TaxID=2613784 RepID=UPI002AB19E31|nr:MULTISPECIES: hypothetical protein [unclassified Burkholderia]